ncbi:unnamed protein product [Alternaria alternata]
MDKTSLSASTLDVSNRQAAYLTASASNGHQNNSTVIRNSAFTINPHDSADDGSYLRDQAHAVADATKLHADPLHNISDTIEYGYDDLVGLNNDNYSNGMTIGMPWEHHHIDAPTYASTTIDTSNDAFIQSQELAITYDTLCDKQHDDLSGVSSNFLIHDQHTDPISGPLTSPHDLNMCDEHTRHPECRYVSPTLIDAMQVETECGEVPEVEEHLGSFCSLGCSYSTPVTQAQSVVVSDLMLVVPTIEQSLTLETAPLPGRSETKLTSIDPVRRWLYDHPSNPYPTEKEKAELAAATGITVLQLSRRLTNLRGRERHETLSDNKVNTTIEYRCTQCESDPFKDSYSWKRHEIGVHHFGGTRWYCMLNNQLIMAGGKCIFCSDIVGDTSHFNQHNIQICMDKEEAARVFYHKDGLKQHVTSAHLHTANDYTKKGFEPPKVWSETEDGYSPDPEGLWCGFCQHSFETTAVRMGHVEQHFEDGFQMSAWVGRIDAYKRTVA